MPSQHRPRTDRAAPRRDGHRIARTLLGSTLGLAALGACGQGDAATVGTTGADAATATTAAPTSAPTTTQGAGAAAGPAGGAATAPAGGTPTGASTIDGVAWRLTAILEGESTGAVPNGVEATVRIDGQTLTVSTGCNSGGATVATAEGRLALTTALQLTQRACDADAMRIEQFVVKVLESSPLYRIDGGTLRLDSGVGRSLTFTPAG